MGSRPILASQYSVAFFFTRRSQIDATLPLALTVVTYVVSAILYASVTRAFTGSDCSAASVAAGTCKLKTSSAHIAWDVIGVAEITGKSFGRAITEYTTDDDLAATLAISTIWGYVSYKGTHIMNRMALLPLIVLGEVNHHHHHDGYFRKL